ncbi:MAG: translation initiation factor IF-3 [Candidatus Dojkabacteria bacterium]|nr:MAG: translation initiation factor IF-3 [Candidatus Dojkabacteria bacterium]
MFKKRFSSNKSNNKFPSRGPYKGPSRDGQFRPRQPYNVIDPFEKEHPRNEAIMFDEVRVIDESGENLGIMSKSQAITIAKEQELDLVLTAPQARPPVCKIVDWEAFKYHTKKKEKEIKKNQKKIKVKEIKVSPKIAGMDLERKVQKVRDIVEEGDQVKLTIMRKWPVTPEQANVFKETMLTKLDEYCTIISVQQKGKNIYVLLKSKPISHAKKQDKEVTSQKSESNKEG